MKIWIDTDAGVDDSTAILIALAAPNVEIVGISCVGGNTNLDHVIANVNRTLNVFGGSENIPILGGCRTALLHAPLHIPDIHGSDGLGDIDDAAFGISGIPHRLDSNHAVNGIIEAGKQGDVVLLALAPLTNIALAMKMAPQAVLGFEKMIIMGGAENEVGNVTKTAEFNFICDPEAAAIVFREYPQERIVMSSWPLCDKYAIEGEDLERICGVQDKVLGRWMRETWKPIIALDGKSMRMPDPITAFICCYGEKAVVEAPKMHVNIVVTGEREGTSEVKDDEKGTAVVTKIDFEFYKKVLMDMMALR